MSQKVACTVLLARSDRRCDMAAGVNSRRHAARLAGSAMSTTERSERVFLTGW